MLRWLLADTAFTILMGGFDQWAIDHFQFTTLQGPRTGFSTLNMVMVSNVVFGLTLYLLEQREQMARALATARDRIVGLETEVASARRLGQYTLQTRLGEGGMGAVYRGPMPPARALHILELTVGALAEAHEGKLIHRDIKPANLMLCGDRYLPDVVKVMDFGLVKELKIDSKGSLTELGMIAGTPHYMSPESISSPQDIGPPTDVYAVGCVAYFLLSGRELFSGATPMAICGTHLHVAPDPNFDRVPDIDPAFAELITQCVREEPEARPTTEALCEALVEFRSAPWARWTREMAQAWWRQHASDVAVTHRETPVPGGGETLVRRATPGSNVDVEGTTADVQSPSDSTIGRALRESDIHVGPS